MMGVLTPPIGKTSRCLTLPSCALISACSAASTSSGWRWVGQRLEPDGAVLACRVEPGEFDRWWCRCGGEGAPRDTVSRRLAHEPFGWRPTTVLVTIRRFRCTICRHVWR